jgi:DNA-binding transcriptional regulator LsrR (DeoR family)
MSDPAPVTRKAKRSITDEERIEIALERFEPLTKNLPLKEISVIATEHDRHPSVITDAIKDAFARKLVSIVRLKHPGPARVVELEEKLERRFPNLRVARVIKAQVYSATSTTGHLADKIHQELGKVAAGLIAKKLTIRDEDIIGIGSGRGVYAFIEALGRLPTLRAHNVTAVSLTGDVDPRRHEYWDENIDSSTPGINLSLDADVHANFLGLCFPRDLNIVKISALIAWERGELTAMRKRTILDRDTWKTIVPNLAIVGIGVFSHGHRFYQAVKGASKLGEKGLTPILGDLRELKNKLEQAVDRAEAERYVPVADVCNRLFYVKPPPDITINSEREKQIKALIDRINDKLLCASEEQLKDIKQLMLVAGTLKKAQAIKQLLEEGKYNIRIICVDEEAAEAILAT